MSESNSIGASIAAGLDKIHDSWGWFVALGLALIVFGAVCIFGEVTATLATVLAFGWLLIMGAIVALIQAFQVRTWSGFFLFLLSALLRGFTGYLLVRYPLAGEYGLTVVLASLFIVGGLFRAIGAGALSSRNGAGRCSPGSCPWPLASCCSRNCRHQVSGSSEWPSVSISFSMADRSLPSARRCAEFRAADPSREHEYGVPVAYRR